MSSIIERGCQKIWALLFFFFSLLICKMGHVENTYKILTKVFTGMSGDDRL